MVGRCIISGEEPDGDCDDAGEGEREVKEEEDLHGSSQRKTVRDAGKKRAKSDFDCSAVVSLYSTFLSIRPGLRRAPSSLST